MIQRHTIVLWKKADSKERDFESIAMEAFNTLNVLNKFEIECRPNFLTTYSKEKIELFDWSFENFSRTLKEGINKGSDSLSDELGYTISFFSSKNNNESFSYQLTVGNKNSKFYNTLVIGIPISVNLYDEKIAEKIIMIFKECVRCFNPFWGCISNKAISRKYGKFMDKGLPTTVHWVNYWSTDIINKIGIDKIQNILKEHPIVKFESGILKIKNTPLNVQDKVDMDFHKKLESLLSLNQ